VDEHPGFAVGEEVARLRHERKLSQRQLDRLARLSHGYTSKLEALGIPNPGLVQLRRLAAALDIPLAQLLTSGEDSATSGGSLKTRVPAASPASLADEPDIDAVQESIRALRRLDPARFSVLWEVVRDMHGQAEADAR
jgi:transcriptional regulator with XRE-family HTH domain